MASQAAAVPASPTALTNTAAAPGAWKRDAEGRRRAPRAVSKLPGGAR